MAYKEDHNLFAAGKYGSFKGLHCTLHSVICKNLQNIRFISPETHVTVMKWADEEERELLLGTANSTVKVYDTECKSFVQSIPMKFGHDPICGVSRYRGTLITAVESGKVQLWSSSNKEIMLLDPEDLEVPVGNDTDLDENDTDEIKFDTQINAGCNLSCMKHNDLNKNIIGCGGRNNDLKLWDLNTTQKIFHAKNLPDDAVRLTEPIWVSDMAFLNQNNGAAVCSRYGYVRLFDPNACRKPLWNIKVPEQALTCLAVTNEHNLICGMAKGDMIMVDMRMKKIVHKYKGFLGAVRGIACHPSAPYIASVSLDRHFRIHHRESKALLVKEYLKLPLHCVVMRSDCVLTDGDIAERKTQKRKGDDKDLEDYSNFLDTLEKVEEPKAKKNKTKLKQVLFVNPFANNKPKGDYESSTDEENSDRNKNRDKQDDDVDEEDEGKGEDGEEEDSLEGEGDEESEEEEEDGDRDNNNSDDSDCIVLE